MTHWLHIEEVKSDLKNKKDIRLETLNLLTEPKWSTHKEYYEEMWQSLFRMKREYHNSKSSDWVYLFLDDIIDSKKELPYFYYNNAQRTSLLKKLKKHTDALKIIFEDSGLNAALISNDGQFFHGFYSYDDKGDPIMENGLRPKVAISDVLEFFLSYAEEEVSESAQKGKVVERQKSNRFVRCMAARNLDRYGKILAQVIATAAFAIYGQEYTESDIANLVYGRKKQEAAN